MADCKQLRILVDADACPVKDEVYRVAGRHGLLTILVSNQWLLVPQSPLIERVVVPQGPDLADDWIAEHAGGSDIVITSDVPLASRCVAAEAIVLRPCGREFDERSMGDVKALRDLMSTLRETGVATTYNRAFTRQDRSRFLSTLDTLVVRLKKRNA